MRNREFEEKQQLIADYFGGDPMMAIVADVMGASRWDHQTIVAREQRFLHILSDIVGIELSDTGTDPTRHAAE